MTAKGTYLDRILAYARARAARLRASTEPSALASLAASAPPALPFTDVLRRAPYGALRVIAEVKRRSPSRGAIDETLVPSVLARRYERSGADAISVLTEPVHFGGSLDDLVSVRGAVGVPVLRKDFLTDPLELWEARASGADAALLIVAALDGASLDEMIVAAGEAGLGTLVEAHDEAEAERAVRAGAAAVGVNARDLRNFRVDLSVCERVVKAIPSSLVRVAESGILSGPDAYRMFDAGFDAVLVGEALVRAPDPSALVTAFRARPDAA